MKGLMWFRNDLRMDDNPALRNACIEFEEVQAIYIFSSRQNNLHNDKCIICRTYSDDDTIF